jgi:hypothetical protein
MRELESLVASAGMSFRNVSVEAFRLTLAIEGDKGLLARVAGAMPDRVLRLMKRVIPTHIYLLQQAGDVHGG